MKVGILTLPIAENYGGILQAVALYNVLTAQGHDVVLIYKPTSKKKHTLTSAIKAAVRWALIRTPFHDFKNFKASELNKRKSVIRRAFHRPFIERMIPNISEELYTTKDLKSFVDQEGLDAVIVGSDQVWRKRYIDDEYYLCYFLDFVDRDTCKKIAYAASFGTDRWEGKGDTERISQLLSHFSAISTREASGVSICQNTFGYSNAVHLLDPTLIVDKNFYVSHILNAYAPKNARTSRLLTYVLDEEQEKAKIIQRVKLAVGIEKVSHLKGFNATQKIYSVPEWLTAFYQADYVVTDSFHGMLFSVIFEKNFVVIGNPERGMERFTSFLSQLGLSERLIYREIDLTLDLFNPIDYKTVNKTLSSLKIKSKEFLAMALNGNGSVI